MKTGTIICIILFVVGAALALIQLWFTPFETKLFTKIMITDVVLFVVVLGVTLAKNQFLEDKKLKESKYID